MYSLGYDIGSSSVKAALVDLTTGKAIGRTSYPSQEMPIEAPEPGWAEQAPEYWWHCVVQVTQELLRQTRIDPASIQCVGIAYQMHGLVLVDESQRVLRPSIIWCDSRAVGIGQEGLDAIGTQQALRCLLNSPGNFTASKLRWVQQHEPQVYERIHKAMLPGDYIAMRLSGSIQTTITGLSEGIFWDFDQQTLAQQVLGVYGIDPHLLPEIVPAIGKQAEVCSKAAEETGLPIGIPVSYRAGDQPNNALSLGVLNPGEVAATGGTSGVVYAVTDKLLFDPHSRVNAFAHVNYAPESPSIGVLMCINGAGIQYNWLRQLAGPQQSYESLEVEAASVSVGAEGLIALPFGNGAERILQDNMLGAQICGIDFNRHHKAHVIRAGLEGIAFAFIYGMEILKEMGLQLDVIRVGNDNLFLSKIFSHTIATLSGCRIEMFKTTGAIGAAGAAAVGAGIWDDLEEIKNHLEPVETFSPIQVKAPYQEAYQRWKNELLKHL
ncbi:MAG: carbohydrate kinase [Haliscomenobacter sp.]|nr:carbohydrate kinase [Haliscomenobacter sp.]